MNADESNAEWADTDGPNSDAPRQTVVKSSARRARLTPAPNTDPAPKLPAGPGPAPLPEGNGSSRGENDDRLKLDRPPHW